MLLVACHKEYTEDVVDCDDGIAVTDGGRTPPACGAQADAGADSDAGLIDAGTACPSANDWYTENGVRFASRVPITVQNGGGAVVGSLELQVTLDTASLIGDGLMRSDCADVRFVGAALLDHALIDGCGGGLTKFWVRLDGLQSGVSSLFLYSGSPSATSISDSDRVFSHRVANGGFEDPIDDGNQGWSSSVDCRGSGGCSVSQVTSNGNGAIELRGNCCNSSDPNGTSSTIQQRLGLPSGRFEVIYDLVSASCGNNSLIVCADPIGAGWCDQTIDNTPCSNATPARGLSGGSFDGGDRLLRFAVTAAYGSNGSGVWVIDNVRLLRVLDPVPVTAAGARETLEPRCRD